ncbi:MAG: hypothetical protein GY940_48305, partial [bacterium]|nr:hypothetical protein [bacterium]
IIPAAPGNVYGFVWTPDSRRLLYWQDQAGNENYHIYLTDINSPAQKSIDLTPFENTRAGIHRIIRTDPEHVLITHNQRDKAVFDLYRLNLNTREQTLVAVNSGDVLTWITDDEGHLRARIRKDKDETRSLEVRYHPDNTWKPLIKWGLEESAWFLSFTADNRNMWMLSNRGRDRLSLVQMDLETGNEKLIYED